MLEKIKNDKLKFATIVVSIAVFVVGLVITIVNSGDTYALELDGYACATTGYEVVNKNGTPVCCPSGSSFNSSLNTCYVRYTYSQASVPGSIAYNITNGNAGVNTGTSTNGCVVVDPATNSGYSYQCNLSYQNALNKYLIQFNGNGGTQNIPAMIEKIEGKAVVLPQGPTRDGYKFMGWSSSKDATVADYSAASSFNDDDLFEEFGNMLTFYAVWKKYSCYYCEASWVFSWNYDIPVNNCSSTWKTTSETTSDACYGRWTVKYDANGGTGAPETQRKYYGTVLDLSSTRPSRSGYTFLGWDTSSSATSPKYQPGDKYSDNANVTLYAVWQYTGGGSAPIVNTYTVEYDANGGTGAPAIQTKTQGIVLELDSTVPVKNGFEFLGWGTSLDDTTPDYQPGDTYTNDASITLYAIWDEDDQGQVCDTDKYNISYVSNGGDVSNLPNNATIDAAVVINNPSKEVSIIGDKNGTGAVIDANVNVNQDFDGWTSNNINTSTAYYDDVQWINGNTKIISKNFKNLTNACETVTMVANWKNTEVDLPTVIKEGSTCEWNTKSDGSGKSFSSGGKYVISSDSPSSINVYAICDSEDIDSNVKTGDILIYTVWLIGIGALGYSTYYFIKRKDNV